MLQTQVAYWQLQETKQHNRATEGQAQRELDELARHNQLTERLGFFNYAETAKHNRATERLTQGNLQLGWFNAGELARHNKSQEQIGQISALANKRNAATNAYNALTQARKVGYENINTIYANKTNRMNAINNQANTVVRQQELLQTKRSNDIKEAGIPAQYLNMLPTPKQNVVRKVTKTTVKKVAK